MVQDGLDRLHLKRISKPDVLTLNHGENSDHILQGCIRHHTTLPICGRVQPKERRTKDDSQVLHGHGVLCRVLVDPKRKTLAQAFRR